MSEHQSTLGRFFSNPKELTAKRDSVARLLQQNRDNVMFRNNATNLYCDRRQEPGRQQRRGVTTLLKKNFYDHYEYPEKRRGRSGVSTGSRLHRHIFHRYMCLPLLAARAKRKRKARRQYIDEFKSRNGGREPKRFPRELGANGAKRSCRCERKYGSTTHDTRLKKDSPVWKWLAQADEFLAANELTPIACEVIVSCSELSTEVDMLAWKDGRRLLCNVSWKTGSNQQMDSSKRCGMMTNEASHIANTEHQHAQLQQFVEDRIMNSDSGHQLKTDEHYIVFFGSKTDGSIVVKRDAPWRSVKETSAPLWDAIRTKGLK